MILNLPRAATLEHSSLRCGDPNHKIILLLLHNFTTVMNCNRGVVTLRLRITVLERVFFWKAIWTGPEEETSTFSSVVVRGLLISLQPSYTSL